jgi:hypothetical protein
MIEALGILHAEVTSVLINGKACDLDKMLLHGDKGSPGIADAHMGKLARMLRMAGFNTLYRNDFDDAQIAQLPRWKRASY